jgi:C4-dicarboxylate-specific signal transduction histidine kinase
MTAPEDREAAFVAQVTAGTTHEIRNILAIVKESAGLIEDLIDAFNRRGSLDQDKLMRSLGRIDAQVARGTELLSNLSRFAHSLDDDQDAIDVTSEIQQVASLCQFRARGGRHLLQVQTGGQNLTVLVNPFRFQMSLFAAVECCLEQLPEGSTVSIGTDRKDGRPTVEFTGPGGDEAMLPTPTEATGWSRLVELADELGASVEAVESAYGFRISLPAADASPPPRPLERLRSGLKRLRGEPDE